MMWPSLLSNARLRAQPSQLRHDCTATIERWLRSTSDTPGRSDAELAGWVLTEQGAALRERWTRQLEEVVGEVVGPIWSKMDAAEEEDIAAAGGDGVVLEAFEGFAFEVEDLVGAVLESNAVLPQYANEARKVIARLTAEGADAGEQCLPGEWPIMPLWEWLGGYLSPPLAEPPGPEWERVARIEGGHQSGGTRAPDLWIHRPTAPARYLMVFAASLWESEWKEEAQRAKGKPPALVFPVYSGVGSALRFLAHRKRIETGDRQLQIPGLRPAFEAGATALRDAMQAAAKASPVIAHRLIRSVVQWGTFADLAGEGSEVCVFRDGKHELWARKTAGGVDIVCRTGGLDFFTRAIGHTSKRDSVGDVLDIFAGYGADWNTPRGRGKGPLLHWKGVPGSKLSFI